MYKHDGQDIFVIDGHMHFWDAKPENWRNKYGESWIKCFYAYHSSLSPADAVWPFDKFCQYGEEAIVDDLFRTGHVDMSHSQLDLSARVLQQRFQLSRTKQRRQGQVSGPVFVVWFVRSA